MSKQLRAVLLKLRDERLLSAFAAGRDNILNEFVFPSHEGKVLDPDNLFHRYFLPVLTKAGLRRIRLHDLRHTFASYSAGAGGSLPMIGALLGHSQPATTARYAHLAASPLRELADRTTALIAAASLVVLFLWKVNNPLLMAVTAAVGLIAYPLLQPTWVMVK